MLNSFQHLTGKPSLTKDLCLSTSFDVGQMPKRVRQTSDYVEDREFCAHGIVQFIALQRFRRRRVCRFAAPQALAVQGLTTQGLSLQRLMSQGLVPEELALLKLMP